MLDNNNIARTRNSSRLFNEIIIATLVSKRDILDYQDFNVYIFINAIRNLRTSVYLCKFTLRFRLTNSK